MRHLYLRNYTLLQSEDKTYPGMVSDVDKDGRVFVIWYKWGYDSPDVIRDSAMPESYDHLVCTADDLLRNPHIRKLPPNLNGELTMTHAQSILAQVKRQFIDPVPDFVRLELEADGSFAIEIESADPDEEAEEIIFGDNIQALVEHALIWLNDEEVPD